MTEGECGKKLETITKKIVTKSNRGNCEKSERQDLKLDI